MAAPRKRPSSGFTVQQIEESEEKLNLNNVEETQTTNEVYFTEKPPVEEVPVTREIVPTEDPGPRFSEDETPIVSTPVASQPRSPKRHPRNIPKFSRLSK